MVGTHQSSIGAGGTANNKKRSLLSSKNLILLGSFITCVSLSNFAFLHMHTLGDENRDHKDRHQGINGISLYSTLNKNDLKGFVIPSNIKQHFDLEQKVEANKIVQEDEEEEEEENAEEEPEEIGEQHEVVAGLSCKDHGGPADEIASEMIFWSDIQSDSNYKSPFYDEEKYITFEPDHGGWNNIRMAMETILVLAHAMGRTLVLPPDKGMYLLGKKHEKHKNVFSFNDFFHLDSIAMEHEGLNIITMEEFLVKKGITGQLKSVSSGEVLKPPNSKTKWDGAGNQGQLFSYLEKVGKFPPGWEPTSCVAAIPSSKDPNDVKELQSMIDDILNLKYGPIPDPGKGDFDGKPTPVDGPAVDRLREILATRKQLCIYDEELQNEQLIHFKIDHEEKARMLTHFYAFVYFQDWRQDLWSKRFVRDHIRYIDEIVCAAARIVNAVRAKAKSLASPNTNNDGEYDSFHIRRGDFQYKKVKLDAIELYKKSQEELQEGSLLYIATDERDKAFFNAIKEHYNVTFLDDYMDLVKDINPNYYGMLDQLVAYKGRIFFGTWFSTLTGYVNRMRGYYSAKYKLDEYENGAINSYYFYPNDKKYQMRDYRAVKLPIYMREFPTSWRDIDKGIGELGRE